MRLVCILVLLFGCGSTPNPKSCLDHHCSDPGRPFCDVDGSIGGEPNTCIAVDCTPNAFEECRDDRALTCNASGDSYDLVECEFGCGATGCNACSGVQCEKRIVPKYVSTTTCAQIATSPLVVSSDLTFDTSVDANCTILGQQTGPEICVVHHSTITIERNKTVTVVGARALALVADYALLVDGIVDASASVGASGPGGGLFVSGAPSGDVAGGGAGYRHKGGGAGTDTTGGGAANGGDARPNPVGLTELFGGARSTQSASNGGGAVTVISCRDTVSIPGVIDVGGGGGASASRVGTTYIPPKGGGAGGTLVIQGLGVSITGELYANGGGGGGGGFPVPGDSPKNGEDGRRSTVAAAGGAPTTGQGGGVGGLGGTIFQPGGGAASTGGPGAGGGSAGFIVVHTPDFIVPTITPTGVSPAPEPRQTIPVN